MMEVKRIIDIPRFQLENYKNNVCIADKKDGIWNKFSTEQFIEEADKMSLALLKAGIGPNDKVANIANNRTEWSILDMGILQIGAVHVPIYPTITDKDYKFILQDAQVKLIFVSTLELYERLSIIISELGLSTPIYTFDKTDKAPHFLSLQEGIDFSKTDELVKLKANIHETDLATLIYTSGTTGNPKGVMLSHKNIVSNVKNCKNRIPVNAGENALSFLPLCHSYERMLVYLYMYCGISVWYAESLETLVDNMKEVKPEVFTCVPRLLEKVFDKIMAKGYELTGIKKVLFFWAVNLGLKYEYGNNSWWYNVQLKIANKLIFVKWREALGGRVKVAASGSAALQERLARVFWAAGIPIAEGYGLSESSPVISVNDILGKRVEFGTVGPPIDGVQVKIAEDGEILAKGDNIMMGYFNREDLTAETLDADGWLHTGDIGKFTSKGNLKITDRKKEIFKTSGGKYIAPLAIESKFKESRFIEQCMVIGENEKFPSLLISAEWPQIKVWAKENNIAFTNNEELIESDALKELFQKEVLNFNSSFGHWEQIKKFKVLPTNWTVDSGELTPTLKLKRKIIIQNNQTLIEGIYK